MDAWLIYRLAHLPSAEFGSFTAWLIYRWKCLAHLPFRVWLIYRLAHLPETPPTPLRTLVTPVIKLNLEFSAEANCEE